jgi:hypothetical protein
MSSIADRLREQILGRRARVGVVGLAKPWQPAAASDQGA